jgi:hypothetical protein
VAWAAPDICDELSRLHAIRGRKLHELATALWGEEWPPKLVELQQPIEELEQAVVRCGEDVAILKSDADEFARESRHREARLRSAILNANLEITLEREGLEVQATEIADLEAEPLGGRRRPTDTLLDGASTESDEPPASGAFSLDDPRSRLRRAERRLASLFRARQQGELELQTTMRGQVSRLRRLEDQLAPLCTRLAGLVHKAARPRWELREHLVEFGKIDGVIASYQGLLEVADI